MSEPFRFSIRALLFLTTATAAIIALDARAPQLAMMSAVAAVWGALLFYPDVLHRLAEKYGRMFVVASFLGAALFGSAMLYQEAFVSRPYPPVGLAGWTMVCFGVAVWGCFRRTR